MCLLILEAVRTTGVCSADLHPNMYLLILMPREGGLMITFHLHPNMYLLILGLILQMSVRRLYLHPNMYLLIRYLKAAKSSLN